MPGPAAHPAAKLLREGTRSLVTAWEKKIKKIGGLKFY